MYAKSVDRSELLRACYVSALRVADELGARTVAFPLISSGIYGWPIDDAARQALAALSGAATDVAEARLVLYGRNVYEIAVAARDE